MTTPTPTWDDVRNDPVVEEMREAGIALFRDAGCDLHVFCERLRESERKHPELVVDLSKKEAVKTE